MYNKKGDIQINGIHAFISYPIKEGKSVLKSCCPADKKNYSEHFLIHDK
jgi:hypothetical protein